jgi:hypothetical protein
MMIGDPNGSHYGDPRMLGGCSASPHIVTDDNEAF